MRRPVASFVALVALLLVTWGSQTTSQITEFVTERVGEADQETGPRVRLVALADMDSERGLVDSKVAAAAAAAAGTRSGNYTPVVFWHGMGDTAYGSINIDRLALERTYPGIRVFSIQIGDSSIQDELAGYFSNLNEQVHQACEEVLKNPDIRSAGAMNAVGFSQGAQFLRALVQRCPLRENGIRVKNLISLGGQHQGVFGLPNCYSTSFCQYIRYMLSTEAYTSYVQAHLVQAQYWHDPGNENDYRAKNIFLPDVNNENHLNEAYRDNLLHLDNLVLVMFRQDEMVVPRESSLFAFYAPGNSTILPLVESRLYLEDRLGLKKLNDSGRLKLISVPGNHLQYKMSWFLAEIAAKYLDN